MEEKLKATANHKLGRIYSREVGIFDNIETKLEEDSEFDVVGTGSGKKEQSCSDFNVKGTGKKVVDELEKYKVERKIRRKILKKFKGKK